MQLTSSKVRIVTAMAIGGSGILLAGLFADTSGILVAMVAIWLYTSWRTGLAVLLIGCLLTATIILSPANFGDDEPVRVVMFACSATALWFFINVFKPQSLFDRVYKNIQPNIEDIPGFGWSAYPDGRLRFLNPKALDFVGVTAEEMSRIAKLDNHSWWSLFVHPDDVEGCKQRWEHSLRTGEPIFEEQRVRRADGTYRWLRDSAIASRDEHGHITAWFATSVDIDDQRKAEAALRESREQLQQMIDTVPALIWCASPAGETSYINKPLMHWTGISLQGNDPVDTRRFATAIIDTIHPEDQTLFQESLSRAFKTGERFALKYRQRRCDGVYRWIDGKAEPLRDADGQIIQWYGVCLDIHDEMEAHEAARQREAELRLIVDTVPSLIWLMTPEGLPCYLNKRFSEWAGLNEGDIHSRTTEEVAAEAELVHPEDRAAVTEAFRHAIATGQPINHKGRLRHKDGQYRWMDSRVEPLRDENGKIIRWYGVNLDIDDEVRAQEALRQSDERLARALRAASMSELSVSIAHELNQPLQAVVANANAFRRWLSAEPPNLERALRSADWIVRDADAAAEVVSRIRALFGKTAYPRTTVDLNNLINDACELIADRLASNKVKLDVNLDPYLPSTSADHVQMEQVILNLIRNGIEAMQDIEPRARTLKIESRLRDGDTVEVEVSDLGTGIGDTEKIFEAFYTTKQDGMGMGLAICRSIIESHGGRLWAENGLRGGASITFSLPVRDLHAKPPPREIHIRPSVKELEALSA
ncbi:PAS domain-containing protein [Rhizobium sp. BK379]|uniref:PAS domain-containing protein n=1 Tax=Rhizobium sp. BK379 TaxID=2587059 RepID=UPI001618BB90|nr:PAS domain-containing protein [Rhizobium sp. BK379]MBB3445815.1 hypothetical protein [Rhizobium sp. BK379]